MSAFLLLSCDVSNSDDEDQQEQEQVGNFQIINDDATLEARYTELNQLIEVDTTLGDLKVLAKSKLKPNFTMRLVSEVESPMVDGQQVQATMVSFDRFAFRAVVSYNMIGAEYLGSVDVMFITGLRGNVRLRSSVLFPDADINAVYVDGNNNRVYTAMATSNPDLISEGNRSALQSYQLTLFDLSDNGITSASLPSYAANSVVTYDGRVYATSGNTGGLTVYDATLGNELAFVPLSEARWVDVNEDYIAVLLGDSDGDDYGSIVLIDPDTFEITVEYPFEGVYTPEAKNTVELVNHLAFIGAGKEGVQVMDLTTGAIVENIPIPDPQKVGLDPDVVTTNAVSVDEDKIFISNGEAGVFVAQTDKDISDYGPGEMVNASLQGRLQFDELESVNHVAYKRGLLVIAAGTGGVKTVSISD